MAVRTVLTIVWLFRYLLMPISAALTPRALQFTSTTQGPTSPSSSRSATKIYTEITETYTYDLSTANFSTGTAYGYVFVDSTYEYTDVVYEIQINFLNAKCHDPRISLSVEDIDFAESFEYLQIYYPSYTSSNLVAQCDGEGDSNCDEYVICLLAYSLLTDSSETALDSFTFYIYKPHEVDALCDDISMNVLILVSCKENAETSDSDTASPTLRLTPTPTEQSPPSLAPTSSDAALGTSSEGITLTTGTIVGIAIGGFALLAAIVVCVWGYYTCKGHKYSTVQTAEHQVEAPPPPPPTNTEMAEAPRMNVMNVQRESETVQILGAPQPPPAVVAALPAGWTKRLTADGQVYYQNDITKQTQWNRPIEN